MSCEVILMGKKVKMCPYCDWKFKPMIRCYKCKKELGDYETGIVCEHNNLPFCEKCRDTLVVYELLLEQKLRREGRNLDEQIEALNNSIDARREQAVKFIEKIKWKPQLTND